MDAGAYLAGFAARFGFPLTQDEWAEALRAAVTPIDETLTLAASVRRQARVAVLTNNNLLVKRAVDTVFPELRPIFARDFFVSAEFHARKPEPEAYLRCLACVGAAADATLFVDDSVKNVSGAERAGLRAHLYRSPEGLERVLSAEGLLWRNSDARAEMGRSQFREVARKVRKSLGRHRRDRRPSFPSGPSVDNQHVQ
jgi:glucose-1-phosphatase